MTGEDTGGKPQNTAQIDPDSHATTTGMTGHGYYDANSRTQWNAIEAVLPMLDNAAARFPLQDEGVITFVDYGCSEGRNSVAVMARALETALPRTALPLQTVHSDLPTNDFGTLFQNLRPHGQSVFGSDRVFSSAVGGSMYDQLRPDRSVHLATTFNAIGFLSRRPVAALPGYIQPNGPSAVRGNGRVTDEETAAFGEQARRDVEAFLKVRARELVPGGQLLVQVFGATAEARTCDGIYDLLNDAVLGFVETGEIDTENYARYYQPVYMRRLEELTGPVLQPGHETAGLYDLNEARDYEIAVPFVEQYRRDGNLDTYAAAYVHFFRAFTEAVLTNALPDTPGRNGLVNRIYAQAEEILKADPDLYPFRYLAVAMRLTRKA